MSARLVRSAAVLGLVSAVGLAGVADATTKRPVKAKLSKVCDLITDPAGNGYVLSPGTVDPHLAVLPNYGQDDAQDILSADVATNAKYVTTVIRVKKAALSSSDSPTGLQWSFSFTVGGVLIQTAVSSDPVDGVIGLWSYQGVGGVGSIGGPATAVVDLAKNEIRATVKLADLAAAQATIKPGGTFTALSATTSGVVVVNNVSGDPVFRGATPILTLNTASGQTVNGTKTYTIGAPSCVVVGT